MAAHDSRTGLADVAQEGFRVDCFVAAFVAEKLVEEVLSGG